MARSDEHRNGFRVPPLRTLCWEVTAGCNLNCGLCGSEEPPVRSPLELTVEEAFKFIHSIAQFADPTVVLTGGEPLYRPDILELLSCASEAGLRTHLATNGTMIDPKMARQLKSAGVERVAICLEGPDAERHDASRGVAGSFEQAIDGYGLLKRRGMDMQISVSLAPSDWGDTAQLFDLAQELEADALHVFPLVPAACGSQPGQELQIAPEQYNSVLQELHDRAADSPVEFQTVCAPPYPAIAGAAADGAGCTAGSRSCFVTHSGDVQPCRHLALTAGNVRERTLREIWEGSELLASLRDPSLLRGRCGACEFAGICSGCRARAHHTSGDYLAEDPLCTR